MKTTKEMERLYKDEFLRVYDQTWAAAGLLGGEIADEFRSHAIRDMVEVVNSIAVEGYSVEVYEHINNRVSDPTLKGLGVLAHNLMMRCVVFKPLTKEDHSKVLALWKAKQNESGFGHERTMGI